MTPDLADRPLNWWNHWSETHGRIIGAGIVGIAIFLVILTAGAHAIWPPSLWFMIPVWAAFVILIDLPWTSSWADWRERFVGFTLLSITGWMLLLTFTVLPILVSVFVWIVYGAILGFVSWAGWYKLFGPVLFYDMVRTSRRARYLIMRLIYGAFLLLVLSYLYLILFVAMQMNPNQGGLNENMLRREMAVLSESFFAFFMVIQLVIVVLLTPAYVAGAIADEKDRKTMEFLLATDLRNREIVLSKFISRIANVLLLLMTGLPIMSLLQFLGGIDTELMLSGFAAIGLTLVGIGSVSILFSTWFQRPRDAISLTYLIMVAYASVALLALSLSSMPVWWMRFPVGFGDYTFTLVDISNWLNAGNPISATIDVSMAIGGRSRTGAATTLAAELPTLLSRYAWFHLTLTAICLTWSILRLRAISLAHTSAGAVQELSWWQRVRPSVGEFPMIWKEIYVEGRTKLNWLLWIAVIVLVILTLGSGLFVLGVHFWEIFINGQQHMWDTIPTSMNVWFRIAGTFVGCLMLLMVGVRAATCVSNERERDTFDSLLTTPMSAEGMLFGKLVGNLTSLRIGWLWFGSLVVLAVLTGGLHPLAVPIILAACLTYSVFVTMIGIGYSIYCKSSLNATVMTILTVLFAGGGHWLITSCCLAPLFGGTLGIIFPNAGVERVFEKVAEYFAKFEAGLTPPFVLPWCAFGCEVFEHNMDRNYWEFVAFSVLGLFIFAVLSIILWFGILTPMFRRMTRRIEIEPG
jgi:ABC-type transport system involved in multi-copper enzyme maturation permease subunit